MGTNPSDSDHMQLKQSESTNQIDNLGNLIAEKLPQELIFEIIVRLPVKSLLKFKCVSKSWLSLISSPQFVRSHFSLSYEKDQELNSQVLITPSPLGLFENEEASSIKHVSLYSAMYEEDASMYVSDIEFPSLKRHFPSYIIDIINGLICLLLDGRPLFWNPALRSFKFLPNSNISLKDYTTKYYGFGYDESKDDYKVVLFASDGLLRSKRKNVAVYSILTDSWRIIDFDGYSGYFPIHSRGKYANGKIHWLLGYSAPYWKIISLDMVSYKFGELQLPEYEAGVYDGILGVSSGRLFLLCEYELKKTDLWVMEKYGVEESWSKVASIPYDNLHPDEFHKYQYWPQVICILRNGEIFMSYGLNLIVYDSKNKDFRKIELGVERYCKFYVYVESLVSPNRLPAL